MKRLLIITALVIANAQIRVAAQSSIVGLQPNAGNTTATKQDNLKVSAPGAPLTSLVHTKAGVWRFHGLGKCIDVGGFPTGLNSPVMLFDCNDTKAQDITVVPLAPDGDDMELRAHGRCLTIAGDHFEAGTPILLAPCDRRPAQRFLTSSLGNGIIATSSVPTLLVSVHGAHSVNRAPLTLEWETDQWPATNAQRWSGKQYDPTPPTWTPVVATAGAYAFKGFGGKCIDIGGQPHPQGSPAFLFDCNGSLAQFFVLRRVDEHLNHFTISAFGRCLDLGGEIPPSWFRGSRPPLVLNVCSGAASQKFAFDDFDRQYIYPAGRPDWVIGVRGGRTDNRTPLELQQRSAVDYQNWQTIAVEHSEVGPKAPAVRFTNVRITDHRDGQLNVYYEPALEVRDQAGLSATYDVYWKPLGEGNYNHRSLGWSGAGTGQILSTYIPDIKNTNQVYVAKARATSSYGIFSESPEIIIDGREPAKPSVEVRNIQDDELTVVWHAGGTPQVSNFLVRVRPTATNDYIDAQVNGGPGTGAANLIYQKRVTGLQPNTPYEVSIRATHELWGSSWDSTNVMTMPAPSNTGPFTTTIWMNRQIIYEGPIPYIGSFGPITNGAVISKINFPTQWPAVLLVKPGYSTQDCGNPNAVVLVHGDMTAEQIMAAWGTSDLRLTSSQVLYFLGCSTNSSSQLLNMLPVNITWSRP